MADGSVEFVAEGDHASLDALIEAVRVGPSSAVVETVDTDWSPPTGEFHRFEVRY
jgi:acylphosphatase